MKKQNEEKVPNVEKEGWDAEEISKEATNKEDDEIVREMRRGDESEGNADERDAAPSPNFKNTPRGRQEAEGDDGNEKLSEQENS